MNRYGKPSSLRLKLCDLALKPVKWTGLGVMSEKSRYDAYFTHSTGHGVGIEVHESPRLAKDKLRSLRLEWSSRLSQASIYRMKVEYESKIWSWSLSQGMRC